MRIISLLLLAPCFAWAALPPNCKDAIPHADEIFQEIPYERGVSCIFKYQENSEYAAIGFFELSHGTYRSIAENSTLITIQDLESDLFNISNISANDFQIIQDYPRDTYVIELQKRNSSIDITEIYKTIKIETSKNKTPLLITFNTKKDILDLTKFESLTLDQVFIPHALELAPDSIGEKVAITSKKAMLFSAPNNKNNTASYLVRGDTVELLQSDGKWIKIKFINRNNLPITQWIRISSIL